MLAETSNWITLSYPSLDMPMPSSPFCVAMISFFNVGVRVMLNNDKSDNTQVLDSSPVERTAGK
jgi:hypothetical protein